MNITMPEPTFGKKLFYRNKCDISISVYKVF